jgi:hypothetical protein
MGVITQFANELRDLAEQDPGEIDPVRAAAMLVAAAYLLEKQEEDYDKLALKLQHPPMIIGPPADATIVP